MKRNEDEEKKREEKEEKKIYLSVLKGFDKINKHFARDWPVNA